jgi:hypothetical protein
LPDHPTTNLINYYKELNHENTIILLTSLILILTVTACGGAAAESVSEIPNVLETNVSELVSETPSASESDTTESGSEVSNSPENTVTLNTDYENALPVQMQLILGTVNLEETEYAVVADQAAELLMLWKAARSLSLSETVATEEMEAIFNQIAETMTTGQLESIVAMRLSQADLADLAESLGIEMSSGGKFGDLTPEEIAAAQAARGGQSPPGGGGAPGGGVPGAGPGGVAPGEIQSQRGARSGINNMFFDAIIEFLEVKVK